MLKMGRKLLMLLLGAGAIAGFGSGLRHLCYGGWDHGGPGRFDRHAAFEQRVADTCTEAALRVYQQKAATGPKP